MTRVNIGIDPAELCDSHLKGEYKEILRIPNNRKRRKGKPPEDFTLGKGHVLWCTDRVSSMGERFEALKQEMLHRGYKPKKEWHGAEYKDEKPLKESDLVRGRELLQERIIEMLPEDAKWTNRQPPEWINQQPKENRS